MKGVKGRVLRFEWHLTQSSHRVLTAARLPWTREQSQPASSRPRINHCDRPRLLGVLPKV